jgi:hypothetical protein
VHSGFWIGRADPAGRAALPLARTQILRLSNAGTVNSPARYQEVIVKLLGQVPAHREGGKVVRAARA